MSRRYFTVMGVLAAVIALVFLAPVTVAGQAASPAAKPAAAKAYTPPRSSDGKPDLQGVWNFATITPLEIPDALKGKQVLTDEDVAAAESEAANGRLDRPPRQGDTGTYNQFWFDRGTKVVGTRRPSLIVDPPDGKLPPLTAEGRRRADEGAQLRARAAHGPEDRSVGERCILGFNAGPPMMSSAYNNNMQLFQTRDYVVILNEMVHSARIVPLDGRPHLKLPQWSGSSRGRWEGDTLVVETKGFYRNTSFQNSNPNMHVVEKFSRAGPDVLLYEFTVSDPTTWTKPLTARLPMMKSDQAIYEYACHEGNYGMFGILSGARAVDAAAIEATKKGSK